MITKKLRFNFFITAILVAAIGSSTVAAAFIDEGMFTPDKIKDLDLAKRGLKIKPSDIYDPINGGISEAIIRLDSGCTGEFVSPKGLILTNHHCGFDALVAASTKEKNLAEIGFKASSMKEEIVAKDYAISIPIRVEDVTSRILNGLGRLNGEAREAAIKQRIESVEAAERIKSKGNRISIRSVSDGYYYYLYEDKPINDIRIVYAPPASIGIFGGDPDNFEWTRHTGDFSFLRAYVAPDGSPSAYSPDNVPYEPREFLKISLDGVEEKDFVFVMGNPGGTTRYRESQFVSYSESTNFPFLDRYLTAWINGLEKVGAADEDKRVALQAQVANLRNSQKLYRGSAFALKRAHATAKRQAEEAKFQSWANQSPLLKTKYGGLLNEIATTWKTNNPTPARDRLLRTIPSYSSSPVYRSILGAIFDVENKIKLTEQRKAQINAAYEDRESLVEREVLKMFFADIENLPSDQRFKVADKILSKEGATDRLISLILDSGDFDTPDKILTIYEMQPNEILKKWGDLAVLATAQGNMLPEIYARRERFDESIKNQRLEYMRGMIEMNRVTPYPDANFTQRFTFGNIEGYMPREAQIYTPFTSLKGMLEKDTGIEPFDAPEKLRKMQEAKDFGRYGVGDSVPLNFLSSTDIIGGNSGSPVLNGYGEQVGLAFDANYEGLGNDIIFNPAYGRTISVDIRYVFFIVEKFDNMGWILDEIEIAPTRKRMD